MSSAYSNRLVGSIVVVALVVIFLPDFLDGKKVTHQETFQTIPTAPEFLPPEKEIMFEQDRYDALQKKAELSVSNEIAVDAITEHQSSDQASEKNELEYNEDTFAKETSPPISQFKRPAWVIQLGSFKNKKNVANLVNKLKREGYLVFTKPIKTKAGILTKVYIGPDLDKQKLDAMIPDLNKLTNTSGKLAIYQPTE